MRFPYPCPGCRSTNNLHDRDCRFAGRDRDEIEKAYTDVLSVLAGVPGGRVADDADADPDVDAGDPTPLPERALQEATHGDWSDLHAAALRRLEEEYRVESEDAGYVLPPPERRRRRLKVPDRDPLRTIYERGSVPGCHDNAVFAMVAYYEMVGFSWERTRELVVEWLRDSGAWDRGGFEESTPEELVEKKRHVHERGYGYKEKARAAKSVIDRSV